MQIQDVLKLFLEQNSYISFSNQIDKEYVSLTVNDWNCKLFIMSTNNSGAVLSLQYMYDKDGKYICDRDEQSSLTQPKYFISDFNEVIPFLNEIFHRADIKENPFKAYYNEMFTPACNEAFSKNDLIKELFKKVLAEEALPEGYSFNFIKDENNPRGLIKLREESTGYVHELDFAKIDEKRPIRALVSRLEISIDIQPNVPNKLPGKLTANEKKEFFMYIPGYELHKYSLLKQYNAIQTINNDLNNWLQEIVDFPNVENNGLQSNLQYHLMQEKLPTKIEPNKKPKL